MADLPPTWDELSGEQRAENVSKEVEQGKLKFPSTVEDWLSKDMWKYPYRYLPAIARCLHLTNKLPTFTRDWVERNWLTGTLPTDMEKIIQNAMKVFARDKRKPFMLYENQFETLMDNITPIKEYVHHKKIA